MSGDQLTLREARDRLADGTISASSLLEEVLSRLNRTEEMVHAYARIMAEEARARARRADDDFASGHPQGPLHGVPLAVKDLCYTTDAPTEAGSKVLKGFRAGYDATVVRRLREAGAILLGKTVTHEFAYGQNEPPTRNAWELATYPGGSSAGSAVAVAVGSALGSIGTDTGGSIRIPAAANGVVGVKPTFGRVSRYGVIPMSPSLDVVGPIARTVEDCAILLEAVAGHDRKDPTSLNAPVPEYSANLTSSVAGLRLGVEREFFLRRVTPDVGAAFNAALSVLSDQGVGIVEVVIPHLDLIAAAALTILEADTSAYHRRFLRERRDLYEPGTRLMLEVGELIPATHYLQAQRARTIIRDGIRGVFETHHLQALATPTSPLTAVRLSHLSVALSEGDEEATVAAYARNCLPANLTGQPAITVPCGFSSHGLPIGLQLVGRPLAESDIFALAHAYEQATDWHTRTPPIV